MNGKSIILDPMQDCWVSWKIDAGGPPSLGWSLQAVAHVSRRSTSRDRNYRDHAAPEPQGSAGSPLCHPFRSDFPGVPAQMDCVRFADFPIG